MTEKLSPEDLAVWWEAYCAVLCGMYANPYEQKQEWTLKEVVSDTRKIADAALAQYQARQGADK